MWQKRSVTCVSAVLLAMISGVSEAQELAEHKEQQTQVLEEIMVVAQRRSQSLLEVPIAISVLDGGQLERAGISKPDDLSKVVPGLQVVNGSGSSLPFLRGVGTVNSGVGAEAGVAFYVDDVYYADAVGALASMDNLQRVEVLKGPQGTLYGRNATGGLIHLITPEPQADPLLRASVGYEEYDTYIGSFYATGGLTSTLKGNISAKVNYQEDGWGNNVFTGEEVNRYRYGNVRAKLLWEPTDSDRITFAGDYFKDESDVGIVVGIVQGTQSVLGGGYPGSIYNVALTTDVKPEAEVFGGSINWEHSFDNDLVFKSVTAYRDLSQDLTNGYDVDLDPSDTIAGGFEKKSWSFQQELLLQGSAGQLTYTGGLFYFTYHSKFPIALTLNPGTPIAVSQTQNPETELDSYAIFGQVDYQFTDQNTLTLGLRYTYDDQRLQGSSTIGGVVYESADKSEDFDEVTWRAAFNHQFTDESMAYLSYSRGYRSGLFNGLVINDPAVDPEILDSYEIGLKGEYLDNRLRLGLSAFYNDYKDMQVQSFVVLGSVLSNAASSEVYGIDFESLLAVPLPVGNLTLGANVGAMHAEITDFKNCTIITPTAIPPAFPVPIPVSSVGDCSGNNLPYAPEFQATLSLNYNLPLEKLGGELGLSMNYYHSDAFYGDPDNVLKQDAFDTVDADISYTFPDGQTRLRIYGRNLTDKEVAAYLQRLELGFYNSPRAPRVFGVEAQYTWQ